MRFLISCVGLLAVPSVVLAASVNHLFVVARVVMFAVGTCAENVTFWMPLGLFASVRVTAPADFIWPT